MEKTQETFEMVIPGMDVAGATVRGEGGDAVLALAMNIGPVKVLQTGGNTLKKSTLKALGLTKEQGKNAIEGLKKDLRLPSNFHSKIMSNGDVVHPHTGEILGNLKDYLP